MGRRFIVEEIEDNPKRMGCGILIFLLICFFAMSDSCEGEDSGSDPTQVLQTVSGDAQVSKEGQDEIVPQSTIIDCEREQNVMEKEIEIVKQHVLSDEETVIQEDASQTTKERKKAERKEKRENRRKTKQSE